jgi:peptidyl-tRNA hydrolase
MPAGKLASQAGHAYLMSYLSASSCRQHLYTANGLGTKICLGVTNLPKLLSLYNKLQALKLPCYLVEDTGRNTTFNNIPTISTLGVGPVTSTEVKTLFKRLPLI